MTGVQTCALPICLGLTIQVLRETGAKRNRTELVARLRLGGKTIEPFKLKAQKVSA